MSTGTLQESSNKLRFLSVELGFHAQNIRFAIDQSYAILRDMRSQQDNLQVISSSSFSSNYEDPGNELCNVSFTQTNKRKPVLAHVSLTQPTRSMSQMKFHKDSSFKLPDRRVNESSTPLRKRSRTTVGPKVDSSPSALENSSLQDCFLPAFTPIKKLDAPTERDFPDASPPPGIANARSRKRKTVDDDSVKNGDESAKNGDEAEQLYCLCRGKSGGLMVACDAKDCAIEWYHARCLKMKSAPRGTWFCPDCKKKQQQMCSNNTAAH